MTALVLNVLLHLVLVGLALRLLAGAALAVLPVNRTWARRRYLLVLVAFLATVVLGAGSHWLAMEKARGEVSTPTPITNTDSSAETTGAILAATHTNLQHGWQHVTRGSTGSTLLGLWCLVSMALITRRVLHRRCLARQAQGWRRVPESMSAEWGLPTRVQVLSGAGGTPMAIGVWRRRIFMPDWAIETLDAGQLRQIAAHEHAHVRWQDPAVDAALSWSCMGLWPVWPLWSIAALARRERESAADLAALEPQSHGHDSSLVSYAKTLLHVADFHRTSPVPAIGATGDLEIRVKRLLRGNRRRPLASALGAVAGMGLLAGIVVAPLPGGAAAWASEPASPSGEMAADTSNWRSLDHYLGYNPAIQVVVSPEGRRVVIQGYELDAEETVLWDQARTLAEKAEMIWYAEEMPASRGTDPPD